jgi:plasmid stabilization system protein ParE
MKWVVSARARDHKKRILSWLALNQPRSFSSRFKLDLKQTFASIQRFPLLNEEVESGIRVAVVGDLPYLVSYSLEPDAIQVLGIYHSSRSPWLWMGAEDEESDES